MEIVSYKICKKLIQDKKKYVQLRENGSDSSNQASKERSNTLCTIP